MNEEKIKVDISERLRKIRKELRYTQIQAAKIADLNKNYYAKVERGDSMPSVRTIKKIARAFKVSASDILGF